MREILFRGKTSDGEWVEGFYSSEEYNIDTHSIEHTPRIQLLGKCVSWGLIPETVGQYTGLTDRNGKRIFEGDIVHCVSKLDSADMVIIFECGQFRMILAEKYHEYQTNVGYYDINCFAKEVIGNIHDNPELLGGENNGINR